ncbi:MAG: sialate O-acetylesterase [Candidatus Brocadiia bacterium]
MRTRMAIAAALAALAATGATAGETAPGPWRVFILSGQSNMEGKGAIQHLEQLLADEKTAPTYQHLRSDGEWAKRPDVLIRYTNGGNIDKKGPLTVGYANPANRFGPELQFGHVVGDALNEQVLLIKVCWGGRSLRFDFRPPSSGPGDFDPEWLAKVAKRRGWKGDPARLPGHNYRDLVRIVHQTLAHLDEHFPGYDGSGFELSGFVWFQGWNDMLDARHHDAYGPNLANLLRDLRTDLGVAELPMVVGELGQSGPEDEIPKRYRAKHMSFRAQQASVARMPEFRDSVRYVPTSPFVVFDGPQFDGGYHYRGRADTFFGIGQAFGEAMLELVAPRPADHSRRVAEARKRAWEKYGFGK